MTALEPEFRDGEMLRKVVFSGQGRLITLASRAIARNLRRTTLQAEIEESTTIQFRDRLWLAIAVVPDPQNGSKTTSPSFVDDLIILSTSFSGF